MKDIRKHLRIRGDKPTKEHRLIILAHAALGTEFVITDGFVHAVRSGGLVCIKPNEA